ncbi:MAG: hypothetical protein ACUVS6_13750 [Anaerolineae bacterium]
MPSMVAYCTLYDLKMYLRIAETDSDAQLAALAVSASAIIDAATRRAFYPRFEVRYYDHPRRADLLQLDDDLLEVLAFTTANGAVTLAPSDYYLTCAGLHNVTPYDRIEMRLDGHHPSLEFRETPQRANAIMGIWGYHEDWAHAWDVVDSLTAAVNATTAALPVSDADGPDLDGWTPRFKAGQLIRVDNEYLHVTAVTASTNLLTVRRAVNGSTAAAHDIGAAVAVYRPMADIVHATTRLAAWLYGQRDQPYAERIQAAQQGIISIPEGLPADVRQVIARYAR